MFNDKILKSVAEAVKNVLQQEALKGQQHKIDKNKNNKIDAHDFKILRGEKKPMKKEETNNPFDWRNTKSRLPTKPGDKAGFDSKKISTGTVYTRRPVKDEKPLKEEDAYDKDRYAVKDGKAVKDNPGHMGSANYKDQAHHVWASSAEEAMKKKGMKEEASNDEFHSEAEKAKKKAVGQEKAEVAKPAVSAVKQESVEQLDEANIQPTGAKSRTHIGNLKSTSNSVVHPSSGKEIGIITKQPNGEYHAHHSAAKLSHSESGTFDSKDKAHQFIRNAHAKAIKNNTLSDTFLKKKPLPQFAKEEAEQLDELSPGLLDRAANKAAANAKFARAKGHDEAGDEHMGQAVRLRSGYHGAVERDRKKASMASMSPAKQRKYAISQKRAMGEESEQIDERQMTEPEMKKREKIVKSMKKGMQGFKDRYGERAKNVMYATATKQAMKD